MGSAKVFESAAAVTHPDFSSALNYSAGVRLAPSGCVKPDEIIEIIFSSQVSPVMDGRVYF